MFHSWISLLITTMVLVSVAVTGCSSNGSGGGGGATAEQQEAASLTKDAVTRLLTLSEDDFATMSQSLARALQLDPDNDGARFFGGVVDFLLFLKNTSMPARGGPGLKRDNAQWFRDLYHRAGYVNGNEANGTFWDIDLVPVVHGEGAIINSFPSLSEWMDFLANGVRPEVQRIIDAFGQVSPDFQYRLYVDRRGDPHVGQGGRSSKAYWIDYGDVMLMKAGCEALAAKIEFLGSYDWNDLKPNNFDPEDNPSVDPLRIIETDYPDFLELASQQMLENARDHYKDAFNSYKVGSQYIRNESPEQADNGLVTLGRGAFDSDEERDAFLREERAFRDMAQGLTDTFHDDVDYTFADGTTVNCYSLWKGVNIRRVFFKTVRDPIERVTRLGVTNINGLAKDIYTVAGVLKKIHGRPAGPGDLQDANGIFPTYAVRVENVPFDEKAVDGRGGDWESKRVHAAATPRAGCEKDLGELYLAKGETALYLWIDENLINYVQDASFWGELVITVSTLKGRAEARFTSWSGKSQDSLDWTWTNDGIEVGVPLANLGTAKWAEVEIEIWTKDGPSSIDSNRQGVFVNLKS